jgi:hypothetical protein
MVSLSKKNSLRLQPIFIHATIVTQGESVVGTHVGNSFFATWVSFLLSINLAVSHLNTYLGDRKEQDHEDDDDGAVAESTVSLDVLIDDIEADATSGCLAASAANE